MKLFIGCSSSDKIDNKYVLDCENLLDNLFKDGHDLVFGADNVGLMGKAYYLAKKYKRKVIGVCPDIYKDDFNKLECDMEIVANCVSDRTDKAIMNSDVLIFLPGGIGTIYEFFSAVESKRSHEHDRDIIIYNSCGYFDDLIGLLDKIYGGNFTNSSVRDSYFVCDRVDHVLEYLKGIKK